MAKLKLSVAVGDYDRMRPLMDGLVQIDGVDPQFMALDPEEIFFRAFRHADFDICELSLSSYSVKLAAGTSPYIAVPVFPSRAFRHTSVYVRSDRIKQPSDLVGRRVGLPEYQLTANVYVRMFLEEEYGVKASDVTWVRGGYEDTGRVEKISLNLPSNVRIEDAEPHETISNLLAEGKLDAVIGPRAPSCFRHGDKLIGYLFPNPMQAAAEWYRKTKIFPIMHTLGIRRSLVDSHPWLPSAVTKAFSQSKVIALERLKDTSATKVTLPFVEEQLAAAEALMGEDFWAYGLAANRHVLERFLRRHHEEGLSSRLLNPDELFHPASLETHRI